MSELRAGLPPLPDYMKRLHVDHRGFPVPYFVTWIKEPTEGDPEKVPDGTGYAEFRLMDPVKLVTCFKFNRCWICGGKMGRYKAFVAGPMCAVNRTASEPPSHTVCAEYAVKACPWMLNPEAKRREWKLPEHDGMAGFGLTRNPGVAMLWVTASYKHFRSGTSHGQIDGLLFSFGPPERIEWWREGRHATREEVNESIQSGLPLLREKAELQGTMALASFDKAALEAQDLLPAVA